jgi:hypothetical protein
MGPFYSFVDLSRQFVLLLLSLESLFRMTSHCAQEMDESKFVLHLDLHLDYICGWRQLMVQAAEYADGRMISPVYLTYLVV